MLWPKKKKKKLVAPGEFMVPRLGLVRYWFKHLCHIMYLNAYIIILCMLNTYNKLYIYITKIIYTRTHELTLLTYASKNVDHGWINLHYFRKRHQLREIDDHPLSAVWGAQIIREGSIYYIIIEYILYNTIIVYIYSMILYTLRFYRTHSRPRYRIIKQKSYIL